MASSTLGELNRSYWNTNADSVFKQEWVQALAHQITDYIQSHVDWIGVTPVTAGAPVTMLDYACGNGVASMALAPFVSTIRGIDVSDSMVEAYNDGVRMQGLPEQQMHAVQGDLMVPPERIPEALKGADLNGLDIIVMSMALHHVEDPQLMTTNLVERLRDGGSILIIDWAPSAGKEQETHHHHEHGEGHQQEVHSAKQTMSRSSFDEEEMVKIFKQAGCNEADYAFHPEVSKLPSKFGGDKQLFFARGKK